MKKTCLIITVLLLSGKVFLCAAEDAKPVSSKITHVTVFSNGAQISSVTSVSLVAGINNLVVQGLSPNVDPRSLQVRGRGNFTVLSATMEKNFISGIKEQDQIEVLRKKIEELSVKIEDERLQTGILREEESFLVTNKDAGGKNESLDAANFKTLFEFYKTSLASIRAEILSRERKIKDMEKELSKLNDQLRVIKSTSDLPSNEIKVTLKADAAVNGNLEINYLVPDAGWYPSYDIRIDQLIEPVSLVYKANVYQNTGVEWKNVKLTFSNAAPNQSGNVPWLNPWYLDFIVSEPYGYIRQDKKAAPSMAMEVMTLGEDTDSRLNGPAPVGFTISNNTTSIEFNVEVPYTIETGGKPKIIDMMYVELPSAFEYQAVPKLETSAFLVARVHDWQKYDLMDGEANLYFENTFVGKSMLNLKSVSDTLNLSLGRDMGIIVKREKRRDYTSEKLIGSNKVVTRSWEISVRNNKKEAVKIQLTDQIPVSQNKDIVVSAEEVSGGRTDQNTGMVTWDISLAAGQSKSVVLTYSVKYPKNSNVRVE